VKLGRPLRGPSDKKITIFDQKNIYMKNSSEYFQIFGHQNPGSVFGSGFTENAGSGSEFNYSDPEHC
jgi:hypothetical protein